MRKFIRFILGVFLVFLILVNLIQLLPNPLDPCPEYSKSVLLGKEMYGANKHRRSWIDYAPNQFCMSYAVKDYDKVASRRNIEVYADPGDELYESDMVAYYGHIYKTVVEHDQNLLPNLLDSLARIGNENKMNGRQFSSMIVSMIQDIPYSYVFDDYPCSERENAEHPCSQGNAFGLITPVEFMHSLVGDCDTRAVALYMILKKFKLDPIIVVSNEYAHAMLAIDLPFQGDHIMHKGKKYYFWETTGTGWPPGVLPPDCNNIDYWHVALD